MAKIWAAINLVQHYKLPRTVNGQFLWPVYCSKVWLQHIKISAHLHVMEAQERHEKSRKKVTSTHPRCSSSGGTPYMCFDFKSNLPNCPRVSGWASLLSVISWPSVAQPRLHLARPRSVTRTGSAPPTCPRSWPRWSGGRRSAVSARAAARSEDIFRRTPPVNICMQN